jgi:hypothetical protein
MTKETKERIRAGHGNKEEKEWKGKAGTPLNPINPLILSIDTTQ